MSLLLLTFCSVSALEANKMSVPFNEASIFFFPKFSRAVPLNILVDGGNSGKPEGPGCDEETLTLSLGHSPLFAPHQLPWGWCSKSSEM